MPDIRVHVKLFAFVRDVAGVAGLVLHLPSGATVGDAGAMLGERFPSIAPHLPRVGFAVNQSYAKPATVLHDGDELALIPPVSGG